MAANSPSLSQRVSHACVSAVGFNWRSGVGLYQRIILASERMGIAWLCDAIHCAQFFSVILLVGRFLLCDIACIGEYADGGSLTAYFTEGDMSLSKVQRVPVLKVSKLALYFLWC